MHRYLAIQDRLSRPQSIEIFTGKIAMKSGAAPPRNLYPGMISDDTWLGRILSLDREKHRLRSSLRRERLLIGWRSFSRHSEAPPKHVRPTWRARKSAF